MLARNFKTATELGISQIERRALIQTLGYLERDDLPGELNLCLWCVEGDTETHCGTTACIAGWAWVFSGKRAFVDVVGRHGFGGDDPEWVKRRPNGLVNLFLSYTQKPQNAAEGLRNYLALGDPMWPRQ